TRLYGRPDDFRRFVDEAHRHGLAVILDVVYNHFGPDGNYLAQFSPAYFTDRYRNEWGEAINYDGEGSEPVRELVLANAAYWVSEYHVDGYRLDATQQIHDASPDSILAAVTRTARRAAGGRRILVIAENESQDVRLVLPADRGGFGLDAVWNDDFHHAAYVALTGRAEAYLSDYRGTAMELLAASKYGYLYQGQYFTWQRRRRGSPALDVPPSAFVHYLENHDQVANSRRGERLHRLTSPGRYRALTALLLLGPEIPLLFQGQEFGSSAPWVFFADHQGEIGEMVRRGRHGFLSQFPSLADPTARTELPDPCSVETFEMCRLDHGEWERHAPVVALHRDLLAIRRDDGVVNGMARERLDGAVIGTEAFALRYFGRAGDDRLLIVNLGRDERLLPAPEPLLAPPASRAWRLRWSSDDVRYGGRGTIPFDLVTHHDLPGESALLLVAIEEPAGVQDAEQEVDVR
ncbi:MAG TPA: alpha-amylase family glycosyl hydrolase, partial [Longimicrobiales bacterium]|nr:alpha-amylase family glycosyl hydrolase [Longimicrobiales bacterium]